MSTTRYSAYKPLLVTTPSLDFLRSEEYARFVRDNVIEAGLRLLIERHARSKDWPYVDTKFNPNTGSDLPPESYEVIYPWFLGRGSEALALHLDALDELALSADEKETIRGFFPKLIANMTGAILELRDRHQGRFPLKVDRAFGLPPGSTENLDAGMTGPGDVFCAKGLLGSDDASVRETGGKLLQEIAEKIEQGHFATPFPDQGKAQALRMLFQAVPGLAVARGLGESQRATLFAHTCNFLQYVLDHHSDSATGSFSEYYNPQTGTRGELLDPGHCTEFVGLGLSAIHAMEQDGTGLSPERQALFARAKAELPRILISTVAAGFAESAGGIVKAVNNRTGEVLDTAMPWWNLPETMRAALFSALATEDAGVREKCLSIFAQCHNAYFQHYLNPANMLFPYQTRSGETGEVLDVAPAIPEGDPLYHSNLCFLEIIRRLAS